MRAALLSRARRGYGVASTQFSHRARCCLAGALPAWDCAGACSLCAASLCFPASFGCHKALVLTLPPRAPPGGPAVARPAQTFKLNQVSATVGLDYDLKEKMMDPKWQLETSVGRMLEVQATAAGCTVSKNWDADLGAMSCNVEVRGHCTWSGRVRSAPPAHLTA